MTDEGIQEQRPEPTEEEREDLTILSSFDEDGLLRAPVAFPPIHIGRAIARGHKLNYFTLLDIEPHPTAQGNLIRLFRITEAGMARMMEAKKRFEQ